LLTAPIAAEQRAGFTHIGSHTLNGASGMPLARPEVAAGAVGGDQGLGFATSTSASVFWVESTASITRWSTEATLGPEASPG